jgi:hypothetical protein
MFTKISASVTYYVMHMAKHHKTRYEQSYPIELISLKPPKLLRPWWNYLTPQIMPLSSEYICHNTQNMGDRRLRGTMYGSDEVYASEVLPSGITPSCLHGTYERYSKINHRQAQNLQRGDVREHY